VIQAKSRKMSKSSSRRDESPLPVQSLSELPQDALLRGRPAPWVQTWKERFLPDSSSSDQAKLGRYAIAYNAPPRALSRGKQQQVNGSADQEAEEEGTPPQLGLSPIVFGAGTFGFGQYSMEDLMQSAEPVRGECTHARFSYHHALTHLYFTALRLAFRYGINTFDTSPYYANSETILGRALRVLQPEHPRSSYYIFTKCGRYGPKCSQFDYSPRRVRRSVEESIVKLGDCGWLDNVFMHDVEFVCDRVGASNEAGMGHADALLPEDDLKGKATRRDFGLEETFASASKIHGKGDEKVLEAIRELFKLKDEGKIKMVGISGYPLPVLLRIARMVATNEPYRPIDSLLSYSNHTLHSDLLPGYISLLSRNPWHFPGAPADISSSKHAENWKAPFIMNASPFSMGLLTEAGPPLWHPCSDQLRVARQDSIHVLRGSGLLAGPPPANPKIRGTARHPTLPKIQTPTSLAETALQYGIRGSEYVKHDAELAQGKNDGKVPRLRTLVGLANVEEVHIAVEAYRTLLAGAAASSDGIGEELVCPPPPMDEDDGEQAKVQEELTYSKRSQILKEGEEAVVDIMKQHGIFGESWQSPPTSAMDV
jgi:D-arabinose 1-dehydrogenase